MNKVVEKGTFYITGAIVSRLILFMQKFWTRKRPISPTVNERTAFIKEIERFRNFWMGPLRGLYAACVFDTFKMKYDSGVHLVNPDFILSEEAAIQLATKLAEGLVADCAKLKLKP